MNAKLAKLTIKINFNFISFLMSITYHKFFEFIKQ